MARTVNRVMVKRVNRKAIVDDALEDDILTLRNYSFISITTDVKRFQMLGGNVEKMSVRSIKVKK